MKKVFFDFTKILMVAFLFVACNNSADNKPNEVKTSSNEESAGQAKTQISDIAFIKYDSLIQNYDMYHDFNAELEKKAKKLQADFEAKVKAWDRDMTTFNEKREKMLLTRSQEQEQGERLMMRQKELQEEIAPKLRAELAEQEGVMNRTINDAIQKYVERYNAEKKYSLILNGGIVITGNQTMDITSEILKGINQEYIASKAAGK